MPFAPRSVRTGLAGPILNRVPPTRPPSATPPGWYPDPSGQPGRRYWDGTAWTNFTHPPAPG
ncbi:DUF2510 domain-containing protein [Mycobacterium sp. ML4]